MIEYHNFAQHAVFHSQESKNIAFGILGGTLLSAHDPVRGMRPVVSGEELVARSPKLNLIKNRINRLDIIPIMLRDSADVVNPDWTYVVDEVAEIINQYHAIILVVGTDTVDRIATAITLGIQGAAALARIQWQHIRPAFKIPKYITSPIVMATSQQPLGTFQSDAEIQIEDSTAAGIVASDLRVSEVMVPAGHKELVRGTRGTKITERGFIVHGSPNFPAIATISASERPLEGIQFTRYAELIRNVDHILTESTKPVVLSEFQGGIESIALNGLGKVGPRISMVEHPDCTGLVVYSHGAGNGPFTNKEYSIVPVIERATKLGKPVLLTTSIFGGRVDPSIYEVGRVLEQAGGIPTGDMTPAAAEVKLAWLMALPEFKMQGIDFIRDMFKRNLVGELGDADLIVA